MMMKKVNFATNDLEQVFSFEAVPDDNDGKPVPSVESTYEAVVYLLETNKHVEDDNEESARGLEKRTEQGAWELYEIQRDGRNAVLGEQEDVQRQRVKDSDVAALRIANAYSAVTEKPVQAALEVALKDQQVVERYRTEESKTQQAELQRKRAKSENLTSPLKSPARSTVVPWGRKVSMPLMDTRDEVQIKERVDSTPIDKQVMEDAAKKALSARTKEKLSETEEKSKKKTKRKKSIEATKKSTVDRTTSHRDSSTRQLEKLEAQKLKDEICELEKRVARKQAAKAKQIAEQMSLGFQDSKSKERKVSKKKSSKSPVPRNAPARRLSKRLSWSDKSAMASMDSLLAPMAADPLSMSLSDVSTCVMTSSELSSSSFDVDGSFSSLGGFIDSSLEQEPTLASVPKDKEPEAKKKLTILSRFRRQNRKTARSNKSKKSNAVSHIGAESSCHF